MAELRVKGTGTLKLFESDNTSSVTIASPASLGADRTVTLPDADVTLVSGTMSTGLTAADITGQTALGAEPADTDEFVLSDAGVLKRVDYSYLKANTPQFRVYLGSAQSVANATLTKIEFDTVQFDDDDIYDETTNYDATLPSTGKWFIGAGFRFSSAADFEDVHMKIFSGATAIQDTYNTHTNYTSAFTCGIFNITNLSDTITVSAYQSSGGALNLDGNIEYTFFYGYKLI